jgi:hypothetical protein
MLRKKRIIKLASLFLVILLISIPYNNSAENPKSKSLYDGTPINPKIQAMVDSVSTQKIRFYLENLVGFYTRHTNSDTVSQTTGIGAARRWIKSQFQKSSDATGGQLRPEFFWFNETICSSTGKHANVMATLPGKMAESKNRIFIVSGHMDNRTFGVCDNTSFAPGANDDGSGTSASIEIARVMSKYLFDATLIFMTVTGEDEGLFGSRAYANWAKANNLRIDGMLTNDVIGNIISSTGIVDSTSVRHFSIGPSNSPSRQLARYFKLKGEQYVPKMKVNLIPAQDRPGRGGDHIPFNDNGYSAVRFTEPNERLEHQHSNTDIIENMSPSYTAQITRLSVAGLASMALAPATPTAPLIARNVGNGKDLLLSWSKSNNEPDFAGYRIAWHHPDSLFYQAIIPVGNVAQFKLVGLTTNQAIYLSYSALDTAGNESIFSTEVLATPQIIPETPQSLTSTSTSTGIQLSWKQSLELDLAGYTITRIGPGSSEQNFKVDSTTISFFDNTVQPYIIYKYYIKARDKEGNESAPSTIVTGQIATHDRGILVIDGTSDGSGDALKPTDEAVDSFYERILKKFNVTKQWDIMDSLQKSVTISDADMGIHSTIIWHSDVKPPTSLIANDTLTLKKYLQNGGRLLMIGWGLIDNVFFKTDNIKTFKAGEFVYDYMKIRTSQTTSTFDRDFIGANSTVTPYSSFTVDSTKLALFKGNLFAMEVFQSTTENTQTKTLYTYRSSSQPPSMFHDQPVALKHISSNLKIIVFNFPLFFIQETDAVKIIHQALLDLDETLSSTNEQLHHITSAPNKFDLSQNYPNPFNPETIIQYQLPKASQTKLIIYNILGQKVITLVDKHQQAGFYSIKWNGKDESGKKVASGIYLYRIQTKNFTKVKKLILIY